MSKRTRKSSASVTLVLVGLAGLSMLSGCSKQEMRRDLYASKEDCLADWGNNPADCEPATDRARSTSGSHFFYGRPYAHQPGNALTASGARSSRALTSTTVTRGGFGSSARSSGG